MSQHGCPERLSNRSKGFQEDGASQPTMEVLVETLTGTAFEMTVSPSDTIFAIKSKICRVEGIPVSQQHLVYNLRELEDAASLHALGIADGARLRLVLGMRGGPISTRRLPPPPEPWRDIERLLDTNRDDSDWSCEGSGSGCRVTVVVFREGERVNMMRVRENPDGSYSPLDHNCTHTDSSPLTVGGSSGETAGLSGAGSLQQNAVTMGKMLELRRRMETLSVRRHNEPEQAEIQKTRSEETLSVPSLLEESDGCAAGQCAGAALASRWRRVAGRCGCQPAPAPRPATYSHLLPPLAARASSDHSVQDAVDSDRVKLSDALAGSILVAGRRSPREQGALLDPPLPARGAEPLAADIPTGPLACGEASGWRARGFGSSSQLASQRAGLAGLAGALLSSSTSDLEALRRHRILPALHRHNNTETLHLSDEALHASPPRPARPSRPARRIDRIAEDNSRLLRFDDRRDEPPAEPPAEEVERKKKVRVRCAWCRKKLSIATVHSCRCGACYCAPHRYAEVHGCAYDYKAAHQLRAAPVTAPKLPKI